jgi:NAD(P)-dependent dehydrogenase (short-subunit alcohol dehydrogenase family)
MSLQGCCVLITGASQGLGFEIAKEFVKQGARIMICARHADSLNQAKEQLLGFAKQADAVHAMVADVSKPDDVKQLVQAAIAQLGGLTVLVANAGIYGPKGPIDTIDWDEWSAAIDINLKGTVLQCREVITHFKAQTGGKIIVLSGGGATKPMPNLSAYAASKAAVVRFAETLAEEVKSFNIDVNSVAPGALNTRLLDEIIAAGAEKIGSDFYAQALKQKQTGGTELSIPVALCVFLASSTSNGITGRLLSALWDPWLHLPTILDQLNQSDVYTLRRITPSDRQKTWDDML